MPAAYTDVMPKRCPACGGGTAYRPGTGVYCLSCGSLLSVETVPVPRPVPTEADRLRDLVEQAVPFAMILAISGGGFRAESVTWLVEAKAALEAPPLPPESRPDSPPPR